MDVILSIFKTLFYLLDSVIYEGVGIVYDLLLRISRTSIFSQIQINAFANRIYALVGIFMLFKVTLSLITYVVNPDSFTDKEKGMANIGKNIIISLILTLLVPYIFSEAYNLQSIILEDNILMGIIFGTSTSNQEDEISQIDSAGDKLKFTLMFAFMQPNTNDISGSNTKIASCSRIYSYDADGVIETREDSEYIYKLDEDCFGTYDGSTYSGGGLESAFAAADFKDFTGDDQAPTTENKNTLFQNYAQAIAHQNFYLLHRKELINAKNGDINVVNYMAPLSTVVGVAVLWLLLIFCIDVAVRSIKLGFYQMIAPIPILSYIDPKSGKDGMFKKWYKACFSTFLSLFIRLAAIYLAIYIIINITQTGITDVVTGERITDWWVIIFVIVGALIFAKQLPKILEDLTGIKLEGFTLNPLKKIENEALGGKAIKNTALGVGTAGLVGGAALVTGQGLRVGAMKNALTGGIKGEKFGKNFASSYGAARQRHQQLSEMSDQGVGRTEVAIDKARKFFTGKNASDLAKEKIDALKKITDLKDQATNIADKSDKIIKQKLGELDSLKSLDPSSLVNRDDFYTSVPDPVTGRNTLRFDQTAYNNALQAATSDHQRMIKAKNDEIDVERARYFEEQARDSNSAISGITAQMQNLMNSMSSDINQGFANTGNPTLNTDNFKAEYIKEAGTAAINARQGYENAASTVHSQTVSQYSQNDKK